MRSNGSSSFKPQRRNKWTYLYVMMTVFFIIASGLTIYLANKPPIESPPSQPIIIGAGNVFNNTIDKTAVTFNIPNQMVDIRVTLNITQPDICFLYALLPFTISNVTPYAIYNYQYYYPLSDHSPNQTDVMKEIGTFDSHLLNTPQ
jgi:hypothetical protein